MAVTPGRYPLGPDQGKLILRTFRDGLAQKAGHDLAIEVTSWSGELTVGEDQSPAGLTARIDLGSLAVREGAGGIKPLTDRDRREIVATARKVLGSDRHPEAVFTAGGFRPGAGGGWLVTGSLTLAGQTRPLELQVTGTGPGRFLATASVVQSEFGIKPYSGFMGALRVRDAVDVHAEASLPGV